MIKINSRVLMVVGGLCSLIAAPGMVFAHEGCVDSKRGHTDEDGHYHFHLDRPTELIARTPSERCDPTSNVTNIQGTTTLQQGTNVQNNSSIQ